MGSGEASVKIRDGEHLGSTFRGLAECAILRNEATACGHRVADWEAVGVAAPESHLQTGRFSMDALARGRFFLGSKAYLCVRLIVATVGADLNFVVAVGRCGWASPMVEVMAFVAVK